MGKILVREFRELGKGMKGVIKQEINGMEFEVKNYLPIGEKIDLGIRIVVEMMDIDEDGGLTFNKTVGDIAKTCFVVEEYTNITLPKDKFEAYDIIVSSSLDDIVSETINEKELNMIDKIVENYKQKELEKYNQSNSMSKVISKAIDGLMGNFEGLDLDKVREVLINEEAEVSEKE